MQESVSNAKKSAVSIADRRLSKEQWLEHAMRLLEEDGPTAMTLDALTSNIGVTTGSFYHHFKSHGRFLDELTDKFVRDYTNVVTERVAALGLPPREALIEAMRQIIANGLAGRDVHFRALAISYPRLADKIRAMDDIRTSFITGFFEGMGYTGDELRTRVHIFVALHSMEAVVSTSLAPKDRLQLLDERVKLLID